MQTCNGSDLTPRRPLRITTAPNIGIAAPSPDAVVTTQPTILPGWSLIEFNGTFCNHCYSYKISRDMFFVSLLIINAEQTLPKYKKFVVQSFQMHPPGAGCM